jgi:hypothetical protein
MIDVELNFNDYRCRANKIVCKKIVDIIKHAQQTCGPTELQQQFRAGFTDEMFEFCKMHEALDIQQIQNTFSKTNTSRGMF